MAARNLLCYSLIGLLPLTAWAETSSTENSGWVDQQHQNMQENLYSWSNSLDSWLGEPDPDKPASASLRVLLDNDWNRYDKYSFKPRIRGKIKLPGLKRRFSLVFGDDSLDNGMDNNNLAYKSNPTDKDKSYDSKQSRNENASVGVRWSRLNEIWGTETDADIGIRSGADVYGRLKLSKDWQFNPRIDGRFEQIYRYGSNSKHFLRSNFETRYHETDTIFSAYQVAFEYLHDNDEEKSWGNSLYRQHNFVGHKRLTYGLYAGGPVEHKHIKLNSYGPYINWRQPVLREWFFVQTELNFYNNKEKDRSHTLGTFLRLEAIF